MITYMYKYFAREAKVPRVVDAAEWEVLKCELQKDLKRGLILYAFAFDDQGTLLFCEGEPIVISAIKTASTLAKEGKLP